MDSPKTPLKRAYTSHNDHVERALDGQDKLIELMRMNNEQCALILTEVREIRKLASQQSTNNANEKNE